MNQNPAEIEKLSPQKLLANFTQSRFALWVAAALVIHVIVIGGMSFGFIRDTWIDPEGAANRKAAAEAVAKAEAEKVLKQLAPAPVTNAPPATVATNAVGTSAPTNTEAALLEARKSNPVVRAITDVAPTNDIPKMPDDLGIGIKDTNVR